LCLEEKFEILGHRSDLVQFQVALLAADPPDNVACLLACPRCGGTLGDNCLICAGCGEDYSSQTELQLDLRLRSPKIRELTFNLGETHVSSAPLIFDEMPSNPDAEIGNWAKAEIPAVCGNRLTPELVSWFPQSHSSDDWMLDLGCGEDALFQKFCEQATGMNYVGVDFSGPGPGILADIHALPFKNATFKFIMSIAVLEHLAFPDVAIAEAFRVLMPGGIFVGTVAFLEPFHMDSYFHMTHLGTLRVLQEAGFKVIALAPNRRWTGLRAMAEMVLFPGVPQQLRHLFVAPAQRVSNLLYKIGRLIGHPTSVPDLARVLRTTAGFRFVAVKED
jgi:SAM-dependent methyltransferase